MIIPIWAKAVAVGIVVIGTFYTGMRVERAFTAERNLAVAEAKEAFKEAFRGSEANVAKVLDDKLKNLKANEREIIREIPKIIDRTVYRNECLDADGLRLIERARTGQANTAESVK